MTLLTEEEREQYATEYMPLIQHIINERFSNIPYSIKDELLSQGLIGLTNAVLHFDKDNNTSFKTFAYNVIYRNLLKYLEKLNNNKIYTNELELTTAIETTYNGGIEYDILYKEKYEAFYELFKTEILKTKTEKEMFDDLLSGLNANEIAKKRGCTTKNVYQYKEHIQKKYKEYINQKGDVCY